MASLTLAGVVYLLAVREVFTTPEFPRRLIIIGLVMAAVWHGEFLRVPPGANNDDDIHRYVWDGRLQRLGYNPYIVVPSDVAFAGLHTPETRTLNNSDLASPYPAGAQLFFRAITAIHESAFALKVAFVLCDLAIVLVLLDILRRSGQGAHLVLAYAWNPLLAMEGAGSGHIDIVGALLLVISVASLARSVGQAARLSVRSKDRRAACAEKAWRAIAALTFGLAVAVKFLPIVLLPLYWKRVRIRDFALAAAVVALLYLPFLDHGRIPIGSLGTYVNSFRFNGPVFAALHHFAPPQLLAGLAVLSGLVTAIYLRRATPQLSPEAFAWPMAASLLCAPVVFPWYLLWLLPFLTSPSTLLIVIWSASIIPTYVMWHLSKLSGTWGTLPVWVMLVEYGCVATTAAVILLRSIVKRRLSITRTRYELGTSPR
jgi:Glycosyltransferase family 87